MSNDATPTSSNETAKELRELAIERGYPHCELLNKAADELQRLWDVAEKRYWVGQRMEATIEQLEAALDECCEDWREDIWADDSAVGIARKMTANDGGVEHG